MWGDPDKAPQPPELLELRLCRDVYHCTPTELAQQPLETVLDHLTCLQIEHEVRELRAQIHPAPRPAAPRARRRR